MKAIVITEFGGPDVLKLEDIETPRPGPGEVLVRVAAVGVNPVDTYLRSGILPKKPQLPYTPGKDAAGVVESVGDGVTAFEPGDRVYTADSLTGTYAEYCLCRESQLGQLPAAVDFAAGAGVWTPYATAYRALFEKCAAKSGETVLVHGASGGVGIAAIQWAKNAGLKVIGTAGSDAGRKLIVEQGVDLATSHLSTEGGSAKQEILEFTGGRGVDIVVEMLANVNLQLDTEVIALFGRIAVVGNRGTLEFNPRTIMGKDATIFGLSLFNARQDIVSEMHSAIFAGLDGGYLRPVINRSFPLAEASAAHEAVIAESAAGKFVLIP